MLAALLVPVFRRSEIHLIDVWDPGRVLQAMLDDGLSAGQGSTYFLTSLLDHPDFDLERHGPLMPFIGLGGSAVPAAVGERCAALGIEIARSFGSTEHPSITGSRPDAPHDKRVNTDGRPLPGVEIRLVDDDGYLAITDRKKDIIIRGGENVSAQEVEELLVRMRDVAEVAVVAAPDARLGEVACAFFRMQPGRPAPELAEVRAYLERAGIARQKWPEHLRAVDEFPRTPSGKVQKFVLRRELGEDNTRS